jgi:metal-sulfur cluster biosynthetic enzyme
MIDNPNQTPPTAEATATLWNALKEVRDPELPVSLVDLGLIYGLRREGTTVQVDLTFTATACPCMDFIREDLRDRLMAEPDVDAVEINVVWDPPWTVERMTPEGREALRRCGVAA